MIRRWAHAYRDGSGRWQSEARRLLVAMIAEHGVTQSWLAKKVGYPRSAISMLVDGARRPSLDLAAALQLDPDIGIPSVAWSQAPCIPSRPVNSLSGKTKDEDGDTHERNHDDAA